MRSDFCILVISHQRADRIPTLKNLERTNYTGDVYVVVDDKDPELSKYKRKYGDQLIVFSKDEVEPRIDLADTKDDQQTALYAREAAWDIAEDLGVEYFMVFDDDYNYFRHRIGPRGEYLHNPPWVDDMDAVLEAFMQYMDTDERIVNLAFSQGGDWIGGGQSSHAGLMGKRKAMNAHLLKTDRRFKYYGRLNADVNTYVVHGNRGKIMLTYMPVQLDQEATQQQSGGLTEAYLRFGTYVKSFYTVLYAPSCTRVTMMGENHQRLHHQISWNNAVPKILSDKHQKECHG